MVIFAELVIFAKKKKIFGIPRILYDISFGGKNVDIISL